MTKGLFITFEGIDGSGKTTQLKRLVPRLTELGIAHQVTREPGGSEAGERIRAILLDSSELALEPKAELYLFLANRVQNIAEIVKPGVERGEIVISDRHRDSSIAFQGGGRELGVEWVDALHTDACEIVPDCTLLFDISVATSRARAVARGGAALENRFERSAVEFHERVAAAYQWLAAKYPERFLVINAEPGVEDVSKSLFAALGERYPIQLGGLVQLS